MSLLPPTHRPPRQAPFKQVDNPNDKDVGRLLDDALRRSGLSQYRLAQRLAETRGIQQRSADQQLRRIRRLGQVPTEELAHALAEAFRPELDLPADHFYIERPEAATQFRETATAAIAEIAALQQRVEELERALAAPSVRSRTAEPRRRREG